MAEHRPAPATSSPSTTATASTSRPVAETRSANSLYSNGGLGIDLGSDGVTANDLGDGDSGPNQLQNFPSIISVQTGATTVVSGTLNSSPSSSFTLDFYASPTLDPSGHGEGKRYLGSATVTTDSAGNAAFTVTLAAPTSTGEFVSATATDSNGNTSEFSGGSPMAVIGGPYAVAEEGSIVLDASGSSDPEQPGNTLTYAWDLDGDGIFGETGTGAGRGN